MNSLHGEDTYSGKTKQEKACEVQPIQSHYGMR